MNGVYATPWEVVEYLGDSDNQTYLIGDSRFYRFTVMMSRKFDTLAKRSFIPIRDTYNFDFPTEGIEYMASRYAFSEFTLLSNVLKLDRDLLSIITLTTNNGDTPITTDNIILRTGYSLNYQPKDNIELKIDGDQTTFLYSGTPQNSQSVDGIWAYHEQYDQAWQTIDAVKDAGGINASVTTITVNDADAFDEQGLKPRFQEQQLLRLGNTDTSEMIYVLGINYSTNVLTVQRGVNGSTAAIAAVDSIIQVFRPQEEIKQALLILSAHAYRRKDTVGREADKNLFTTAGVLVIPQQIPQEVRDMVLAYKRPMAEIFI